MIKVKEHEYLQRDPYSKAIINTDVAAFQEHKQKRKLMENFSNTETRISRLENDISDIKSMLQQLINKK